MKHTTWLQNRTPTRTLDGKTPYRIKNKRKPHLGGIQEFGVAAYVKDLKAGKLDARSQVSRFVGYDSESKGYRIYWPGKRSITVERNVIFNPDDVQNAETIAISSGDILSEGEKDKVIQNPTSNVKTVENPQNDSNSPHLTRSEDEKEVADKEPEKSNTVPFPTIPEPDNEAKTIETDDPPQEYGHGKPCCTKATRNL
jgi:hypothetical protein